MLPALDRLSDHFVVRRFALLDLFPYTGVCCVRWLGSFPTLARIACVDACSRSYLVGPFLAETFHACVCGVCVY